MKQEPCCTIQTIGLTPLGQNVRDYLSFSYQRAAGVQSVHITWTVKIWITVRPAFCNVQYKHCQQCFRHDREMVVFNKTADECWGFLIKDCSYGRAVFLVWEGKWLTCILEINLSCFPCGPYKRGLFLWVVAKTAEVSRWRRTDRDSRETLENCIAAEDVSWL